MGQTNNIDQSENSKIGGEINQVLDFLAEDAETMGEVSIFPAMTNRSSMHKHTPCATETDGIDETKSPDNPNVAKIEDAADLRQG